MVGKVRNQPINSQTNALALTLLTCCKLLASGPSSICASGTLASHLGRHYQLHIRECMALELLGHICGHGKMGEGIRSGTRSK